MKYFAWTLWAAAGIVLGVAAQGRAADVAGLIKQLQDKDPETRQDAAVLLGRMGPAAKEAVPALVAALKDEAVASRAAIALTQIGAAAVPALGKALKDPDQSVRLQAARVLGNLGPAAREALPDLVDALSGANGPVRALAARAVGRIGAPARPTVPHLLVLLKDPDQRAREAAVRALIRIGPVAVENVVPALAKAVQNDDDAAVRRLAAGALGEYGPDAKGAVTALTHALDDEEPDVKIAAAIVLGLIGPDAKPANTKLRGLVKDRNIAVALAAASALSVTDPKNPDALQALQSALTNREPFVRLMACNILAAMGPEARSAAPALERLLKDSSPDVRLAAAEALVRINPAHPDAAAVVVNAIPELVGYFKEGEEAVPSHARILMARILGSLGSRAKAAVPGMKEALQDRNPRVREAVAQALKQIQGE